ncbi:putative ERAD-associated E3 ubiquitin-protein ligase component [Dissostichus eleginoides]|uniref:ERAD-associated E3 ubiquitin-protein ligase component n=1 Tax=Dissostichus eleginoides TaxID=100907 RepID=A0AAD9B1P0_DISEL|nr:putative ERAD-associated E3 ubiquitin-protein ligase component [Dissostichus eleginoides]
MEPVAIAPELALPLTRVALIIAQKSDPTLTKCFDAAENPNECNRKQSFFVDDGVMMCRCFLLIAEIGPDRFLPAPPPHLAADRTGTDPSCSSSPRRRSDRNGPLLLLAENGPLQFLLLSAGPDPL